MRDEEIQELSALCEKLQNARKSVQNLENELTTLQASVKALETVLIPEKMMELGVTEIRLTNGHKVSFKPNYFVSINKEKEDEAYNELEQRGYGSTIKNEVFINLGKGSDELFSKVSAALRPLGVEYIKTRSVHHSTLKALTKEMYEQGKSFPQDLFNVHIEYKTTIK